MVTIDSHRSSTQVPAETAVLAIFLTAAIVAAAAICGLLTLIFGPLSPWVWGGVFVIEGAAATIVGGALVVGSDDHEAPVGHRR
jgi:hypothetical protein